MTTPPKNMCPFPGCPNRKPNHIYACPRHWRSLPLDLQRNIKAAYFGPGALSTAWMKAHEEAMAFWKRTSD